MIMVAEVILSITSFKEPETKRIISEDTSGNKSTRKS